ncbi:MAG: hypothetical protein EOO24_48090 [Comamonadaceae bacterium]|nr:MAG: hypothetical protein EOO24_48090 [Comamonadaceae bacterium]
MATQVLAMFVIRTRGPTWRSRPHPALVGAAAAVLVLAVALPWTPAAALFQLETLPAGWYLALACLTVFYLVALEMAKRAFWAHAPGRRAVLSPG